MSASEWIKAKKSGGNGGNCVEMRREGDTIQIRDSKNPAGPMLTFTPQEIDAWLDGARNREFDHLAE
jgi:hypothetical protein